MGDYDLVCDNMDNMYTLSNKVGDIFESIILTSISENLLGRDWISEKVDLCEI